MSNQWTAAAVCLFVVYLMGLAMPQWRIGKLLKFLALALWTAGRALEEFEAALAEGLRQGGRALARTARETWVEGVREVGRG